MRLKSTAHSVMALLLLQCTLASCAATSQFIAMSVEPEECEIISRMVSHRDIAPVAQAAPPYIWIDGRNDGTPHSRASSATLEGCKILAGRLSTTGVEVSRIAFSDDKSRAVFEIDCGPTYLEKNALGSWNSVATYTSVHGCHDMP